MTVVEDAVRGVEVNEGDSERALADMRDAGAKVASSDELLAGAEASSRIAACRSTSRPRGC